MSEAKTILDAVESYFGGFERRDAAAIAALFAEDATVEDPIGAPPVRGATAIREFYDRAMQLGATLRRTGPIRLTATREAAFPFEVEFDQGGRRSVLSVIDVMEFDEAGKILSMRAFWRFEDMRTADD